jgi:hypothetical protein
MLFLVLVDILIRHALPLSLGTETRTHTMSSTPNPPPPSGTDSLEDTISRLSNYRNVHGVMILSRQGGLIRTEGEAFEGDQGRTYAKAVKGIVEGVRAGVVEVDETVSAERRDKVLC